MALRRNVEPAKTVETPTQAAAQATPEPATTAPPAVKTQAAAPTLQTRKMVMLFSDIQNAFIAEWGVLPRFKVSSGNLMDKDDKSVGTWADIQVLSWNEQFIVGPCDQKAPTDLVKYSYNREAFDDGSGTLEAYVAELRANDWPDAAVKKYYEVVGVLRATEKSCADVGEMCCFQLPPTSVKEFEGYRLQQSFKIAQGLANEETANMVRVSAEVVSTKSQTWTKMKFTASPEV